MHRIIRILAVALLSAACAAAGAAAEETLAYYSDYFSFIGEDTHGRVAFALDTNRGRDGNAFQAEHFTVLHDERAGWVPLHGNGAYPNLHRELAALPDSAHFAFRGSARRGMLIQSASNGVTLEIEPIVPVLERSREGGRFWLGSANARLHWHGRVIPGRVIYEYLYRPGWNRLTRTYLGQWRDFHGLYLRVEGGGDLYLHRRNPAAEEGLTGNLVGFLALPGAAGALEDIVVEVPRRRQARGLYRWPEAWRGSFRVGERRYAFELELSERLPVANWVIGGFAMGIARGVLLEDGAQRPLYGLAELIL